MTDKFKQSKQTDQSKSSKTDSYQAISEQLAKELADMTEALQRERADSDNIRRRHEEQLSALRNVVKSSVVRDLLPVIDNFERSLKHVPQEIKDNDFIKGVQAVVKQFEEFLHRLGVQRIVTKDQVFDPKYHEAVSMDDNSSGTVETVSEELQSGYQIGEEVIRHATVRVTLK
jgi:molecular chaperone GrpE